MRIPGTARAGRGSRRVCFARSSVTLPLDNPARFEVGGQHEIDGDVGPVVIGMDPHKRSVTIEVMNADEVIVGGGRWSCPGLTDT